MRAPCRQKAQRDVDILTKHTAANPTDARWFYYLGDAYAILGKHENAVAAFHNCTDLRGWDEEGAWAMYRAAQSLGELERYDNAVEALAKGMSRHPAIPELPWYASYLSFRAGKHQQAAWWAGLATVHDCYKGTCPPRAGFEYPFARYEGPYDMLRWSLRALGDNEGAEQAERDLKQAIQKMTKEKHSPIELISDSASDTAGAKSGSVPSKDETSTTALPCAASTGMLAAKPRVAVGFTTAKRPEHFKRTYLSFRCDVPHTECRQTCYGKS